MMPTPCEFTPVLVKKIQTYLKNLPIEQLKNIREDIEFFTLVDRSLSRGEDLSHHLISRHDESSAQVTRRTRSKPTLISAIVRRIEEIATADVGGDRPNGFWLDRRGSLKIYI